jgi:hypothetical protein
MQPQVVQEQAVLAEVAEAELMLVLLLLEVLDAFYFTTKIGINIYGYICSYQ